jgi:hypothetical protein
MIIMVEFFAYNWGPSNALVKWMQTTTSNTVHYSKLCEAISNFIDTPMNASCMEPLDVAHRVLLLKIWKSIEAMKVKMGGPKQD